MLRHSITTSATVRRIFDRDAFVRIEQAIAAGERLHRAEIRFAVEPDLAAIDIWRQVSPRQRAIEVFADQGVWDTEENVGILIYLLWADQAVEIIADRHVQRSVEPRVWVQACQQIVQACGEQRPVDGIVAAVEYLSRQLAPSLPYLTGDRDELSNLPLIV